MSLVGNLEDLGLADILQIMSLSRKSGVLRLRGADGEGRIVFREGLVHAAAVKGEPDDLDQALQRAGLGPDAPARALEALRRERVERIVARLFEWRTGEFSFDVQDEIAEPDRSLALATGLSPQYLAMEATRRGDELRAGAAEEAADPPLSFSGEEPAAAVHRLVAAGVERGESASEPQAAAATPLVPEPPAPPRIACSQAVIIDPDLRALEWLRATLADLFERIHVFQSAEWAIPRIRQYLTRGEVPALLLATHAPMDPLSGIERPGDLLRRLRALSPRMPLLLVAEEGLDAPPADLRLADAVVARPGASQLLHPAAASRHATAAAALREGVAPFAARRTAGGAGAAL